MALINDGFVSVAEVRQRAAAALSVLDGYTESRYHEALFGQDTDSLLHHSFAVGVPETELHPEERRQVLREGALVITSVTVQVAHQLRGDNQVSDGDTALDAEHAVIKALLGIPRTHLHIIFDASSRRLEGDGTFVVATLKLKAIHRFALQ